MFVACSCFFSLYLFYFLCELNITVLNYLALKVVQYKNGNHDAFEMLEKLKDVIVIPKGLRVSDSIQATSQPELEKTTSLDPGGVPPPSKRKKFNKQN